MRDNFLVPEYLSKSGIYQGYYSHIEQSVWHEHELIRMDASLSTKQVCKPLCWARLDEQADPRGGASTTGAWASSSLQPVWKYFNILVTGAAIQFGN